MNGVSGARWQDDGQLHITLRFIGGVDERMADGIVDLLATLHVQPFRIALDGIGTFENRGRVDTLWAGVRPHDAIAALHRKIDHALVRFGLPPEGRAYLPHVTLARFARGTAADVGGFAERNAGLESEPFAVTSFDLFESTLGGEGARYDIVARYRLG